MKKVLVGTYNYSQNCPSSKAFLEENGFEVIENPYQRPYTCEELLEIVEDLDAVITGVDEWNEELYKRGKKLKSIAKFGIGVDNIDLPKAKEYGIKVSNAPASTNAVAELVIGFMIACKRNLILGNKVCKAGSWDRVVGGEIMGKNIGFLGFGKIPKLVAKKLRCFDVNVFAFDKYPDYEAAKEYNVQMAGFDEILEKCDIVSLHLPITPETRRIMNANAFAKMKDGAFLINTGRGALVEENALFEALKSGKLTAAASDVIVFPLVYTIRLSFFEWSMSNNVPMAWVGLNNYIGLFTDGRFLLAVARTFIFSGAALLMEVVLGVAVAIFLSKDFLGKNLVKTIFLLPMVATPVAIGLVWTLIYEPTIGIANLVLAKLGIAPLVWLGSENTALISLVIVDIWQWTPMIMLITLAGVSALPGEPFESAMVDGATKWQTLWKITLPLLRPTILVAVLLRLIDVLKTFDVIYSTTQGGPGFATETMNILAFKNAFEYFQFGQASALLVIFFVIVLSIAVLFIKFKNKVEVDF